MNDETRTALIELWRDVPGTKPHMLRVDAANKFPTYRANDIITWPSGATTDDATAEALARDAIVEWLMGQGVYIRTVKATNGTYTTCDGGIPSRYCYSAPTRLSALIAAARAVHKGAERGE